eukprot:SAG25_NODE_60_length_18113_cov_233.489952_17_plen_121_part_00
MAKDGYPFYDHTTNTDYASAWDAAQYDSVGDEVVPAAMKEFHKSSVQEWAVVKDALSKMLAPNPKSRWTLAQVSVTVVRGVCAVGGWRCLCQCCWCCLTGSNQSIASMLADNHHTLHGRR